MKLISGTILSGIFIFCIGMFTKTFSEANNGDIGIINLGSSVAILGAVVTIIGIGFFIIFLLKKRIHGR